jgi:NAD(P)-dependent dehydrogenase (short-subunit alcohol dehydrogenase family)
MLYAHFDYERQIGEAFATEEAEPKGIGVNGIAPGSDLDAASSLRRSIMEKLEKFGSQLCSSVPAAELASKYNLKPMRALRQADGAPANMCGRILGADSSSVIRAFSLVDVR